MASKPKLNMHRIRLFLYVMELDVDISDLQGSVTKVRLFRGSFVPAVELLEL